MMEDFCCCLCPSPSFFSTGVGAFLPQLLCDPSRARQDCSQPQGIRMHSAHDVLKGTEEPALKGQAPSGFPGIKCLSTPAGWV